MPRRLEDRLRPPGRSCGRAAPRSSRLRRGACSECDSAAISLVMAAPVLPSPPPLAVSPAIVYGGGSAEYGKSAILRIFSPHLRKGRKKSRFSTLQCFAVGSDRKRVARITRSGAWSLIEAKGRRIYRCELCAKKQDFHLSNVEILLFILQLRELERIMHKISNIPHSRSSLETKSWAWRSSLGPKHARLEQR